eukprot:gene9626-1830_t
MTKILINETTSREPKENIEEKLKQVMKLSSLIKTEKTEITSATVAIVISTKKEEKITMKGFKYSTVTISDLSSFQMNLFLTEESIKEKFKLGDVILIKNPKLLHSFNEEYDSNFLEKYGLITKSVEKLGNASNFGFCEFEQNKKRICKNGINKDEHHFCEYHEMENLKSIKSNRLELSSSIGFLKEMKCNSTLIPDKNPQIFYFNGEKLIIGEKKKTKINLNYYEKKQNKKSINDLLGTSQTNGAKYLRKQKQKDAETKIQNLLSKRENKNQDENQRKVDQIMKNVEIPKLGRGLKRKEIVEFSISDEEIDEAPKLKRKKK